ncbi:hypothetical protein H0I29_12740 [Polaribacter sp. R2A056_3_33]|uniref:DUF6702 family protein n=1 Tax=unclassified Polaribacter TaxID=196858 RepID=UPI001C4EB36D|nr:MULTISPECIES: DUF6702 family protein [unclassified Polaribacter]QXP64835.1 hypothetical protein H0I27_06590 [Polaribacter sp. HaHaR_3_91]QXP67331.1 hypothetical protein H0I28_02195 [Polaribacter sp. AHE13PA]QXP69484.1 hypothetical protein H0I29_12740 [Polaribacter sp. R2A056_3_33]
MSLTQIEYRSELQAVQITINVFMDDIELALNKDYNIDLQLTTKEELKDNDVYFIKYLNSKLHLKVNDVPRNFNYIGKEYDGDLVYFYLEIEDVKELNNIEVTNKILTKHFPQQENLIKSKVGKKHKSILLTAKNDKGLLKF